MTDEQMNIAICEAIGWTDIKHYPINDVWWGRNPATGELDFLPQHINGIEALGNMHEAEKILTPHQAPEYADKLSFCADRAYDYPASYLPLSSTSRQRAMAWLRIFNLFKE